MEYIGLKGDPNGMDTTAITDMAEYFETGAGLPDSAQLPFAGEEFNATRAGIHADGIVKQEEIYNIFDTKKLLKRPISIIVTDKSGVSSIAYWVNTRLRLEGERQLDKRHPGIVKIYKRVMREYEQGRNTSISTEELERWARRYLPEYFISEFDLLKQKAYGLAAHLVEEVVESEAHQEHGSGAPGDSSCRAFWISTRSSSTSTSRIERGAKISRNITHIVDKAKYESAKVGEDLSDRPWFIEPMRTARST